MDKLELFSRYLHTQKKYSIHTIEAYTLDLKQFKEFLALQYKLDLNQSFDILHVRSWMASMGKAGLDNRSIRRKLSSLKHFCKFLMRRKLLLENPMLKLSSPKIKKRLPVVLREQDLNLHPQTDFRGLDYKECLKETLIWTFYGLGLRRNELIELKLSDVHFKAAQLKVLGKGNKERILPFGNELAEIFLRYLDVRSAFKIPETEYFFVLPNGKKLYPKMVYLLVNNWLKDKTSISKKSPHVLRHSFATHISNQGADIYAVKELLGHSSLAATQIYTHNSIEQLKNAYLQAHPRASK